MQNDAKTCKGPKLVTMYEANSTWPNADVDGDVPLTENWLASPPSVKMKKNSSRMI